MGLAVAILRLECPEILLIVNPQLTSVEDIFIGNEQCVPRHIRNLRGNLLRHHYLDAITELLETNENLQPKGYATEWQNVRTAVLSHVKNTFYVDVGHMKQANPLKEGDFQRIFIKSQDRVSNVIHNLIEYAGNIYYCIECEAIGDRELLLPDGRSQLENCAECN